MGTITVDAVTALATRHERAERRTRVAGWAAAILNTGWLAGHLALGVIWQLATARATELLGYRPTFSGWDPLLDSTDPELVLWTDWAFYLLVPLVLIVPLLVVSWSWLPAKKWFLSAWLVLWLGGLLLQRSLLYVVLD
jgi:hypothetical protein